MKGCSVINLSLRQQVILSECIQLAEASENMNKNSRHGSVIILNSRIHATGSNNNRTTRRGQQTPSECAERAALSYFFRGRNQGYGKQPPEY